MVTFLRFLIRTYQLVFSKDGAPLRFVLGIGGCRYSPTCSEYTYAVLGEKGLLRGLCLAVRRVLRCNSFMF
ncbi:MAG: membrane protein insertion efficiency factor YidD [Candidatus Blackburnbacteria bacterium]|nr:membrane protein insertion efficiency factor YidD [Candidatus Blackburnbacteria bacterium]